MQHSLATFARDAALLAIALLLLFWMQSRLVASGFMSSDNADDTVVWIVIGAVSLFTLFSAVFVVQALFIVPRHLWLEATSDTRTLADESKQRTSRIERELERLTKSMRARIRFDGFVSQAGLIDRGAIVVEVINFFARVHNPGNDLLERCLVKIERLGQDDGRFEELQGALRTEAREIDRESGRFALAPGERKRLRLASRELQGPRIPQGYKIDCETGTVRLDRGHSIIIDLIATAETGGPDHARVRLSVDEDYQLTHEVIPIRLKSRLLSPSKCQ